MNFEKALTHIKCGDKLCRAGWNGENQYVYLDNMYVKQDPSIRVDLIIFIDNNKLPNPGWTPTTKELFSDDWEIVE